MLQGGIAKVAQAAVKLEALAGSGLQHGSFYFEKAVLFQHLPDGGHDF